MRAWGVGRGAWGLLAAGVVACGGDASRSASGAATSGETAAARSASGATTPNTPPPTPPCPADGLWHPCAVVKRLEMAGLVPIAGDSAVHEPPLTGTGRRYTLGRAELTVYLYADARARAADEALLDTATFIGPYTPVSLKNESTRIDNANLLAVLRSRNDHLRERVGDALTAGPPQPAKGGP